jgi:hypothetical protein
MRASTSTILFALLAVGMVSMAVYSRMAFTSGETHAHTANVDAASLLVKSRRQAEARWQQRRHYSVNTPDESWCSQAAAQHGVVPGETWGSLSTEQQLRWKQEDCDEQVGVDGQRPTTNAGVSDGTGAAIAQQASEATGGGMSSSNRRRSSSATTAADATASDANAADATAADATATTTTTTTAGEREAAGCGPGPPRPYHTILTSSSGGYQSWQCRVMYHHWKMQKRRDPCGEMGGFTRLLTNRDGVDDGRSHSEEIPTVVVKELRGAEARGYVVANRPYSMKQFVVHPEFERRVVEDYVYIAETDHILLRPLPNLASETMPVGFNFGYMVAWGQANIVNKFVPGLGGKTDPVGPSPVIIHKAQLKQLADLWYSMTIKICSDGEAVQALGWVREMWGWCIAAGKLGIKHRVLDAFQYEGGSIGNRERPLAWPVPATPVGPQRDSMPYYIFHYTYGIEYSVEGLPMELMVGEWSMDKRHYMGGHSPPRELLPPPKCAHDRAHVLRALWNNASASLPWEGGGGQVDRFHALDYRGHDLRAHPVASRLLGTGPWALSGGGHGQAYRLEKLWILTNGWLVSQKGHGRWGLVPASQGGAAGGAGGAGGGGSSAHDQRSVVLSVCGLKLTVTLEVAGDGSWSLRTDRGEVVAKLEVSAEVLKLWSAPAPQRPADELAARVEGSGPYKGQSAGQIVLLRAGVLMASGGQYNAFSRWATNGDGHSVTFSKGGDGGGAFGLTGGGGTIQAHFTDCWVIRLPDGGLKSILAQTDAAALPPKYGDGIATRQAEWITQPPATLCQDVCAGLTLRKLTAADKAASAAARSLEDCDNCGWSWAGFGGLRFNPDGDLITPWGRGVWGAPPEAQSGRSASILAEFAGFKHLLRVTLVEESGGLLRVGTSMSSTRCTDNDRSTVAIASGTPKAVARGKSG